MIVVGGLRCLKPVSLEVSPYRAFKIQIVKGVWLQVDVLSRVQDSDLSVLCLRREHSYSTEQTSLLLICQPYGVESNMTRTSKQLFISCPNLS